MKLHVKMSDFYGCLFNLSTYIAAVRCRYKERMNKTKQNMLTIAPVVRHNIDFYELTMVQRKPINIRLFTKM